MAGLACSSIDSSFEESEHSSFGSNVPEEETGDEEGDGFDFSAIDEAIEKFFAVYKSSKQRVKHSSKMAAHGKVKRAF